MRAALIAASVALGALTAMPAMAEQELFYNFNDAPLGSYKPVYTYLPHQAFFNIQTDIVDGPYKTRALRLFPKPVNPRLAEFTTVQFDARRWKQMLTVISGSFGSTAGTIEFRLYRTPDDIYAAFTASNGKLTVKAGGKEVQFGTYSAVKKVGGKTVPAVQSFIVLNDLEKKTFKVTMLTPDGESVASKPLPMPITDPFNISPLTLQIAFPNPLEPVMYTLDDIGISANFRK